jgi:O-antigen/teichoic acid export membrane protein
VIRRLLRSDLVVHGSVVFAGLIVANVMNYLYFMLCGRVVGVEGYGELTALTSAVLTLAAPANVAQIVVARFVAELDAAGRRQAQERLARRAVRATLAFALLASVGGALFAAPLAAFVHVGSRLPIVVSAVSLGLYAVITVQRGVLQGASRFGQFSASYCVEAALRLVVGVLLAHWYGAFGALLGLLAGVAGCYAYDELVMRVPAGEHAPAPGLERERAGYIAARIGVAQLMLTVLSFYDVVLVRHLFGARDAGLYAAAALVGRVMLGLLAFVPTLVMPKATARARAGASAFPLFAAAAGVSAAIAGIGALAAFAAPERIVVLFAGRDFAAAAPVVPVYVLAAGALGLANVVAAYQFGLHRYAFVAPMTVAAALETLAVALWHPSIGSVVGVLLAGHAVVLAATLIGLGGTQRAWHGGAEQLHVLEGGVPNL